MPELELVIVPSIKACFGSVIDRIIRDRIGNMYVRQFAIILDEVNKTVVCVVKAGASEGTPCFADGRKNILTSFDFHVLGEFSIWFLKLIKHYEECISTEEQEEEQAEGSDSSDSAVYCEYRYRKERKDQYPECFEVAFINVSVKSLMKYYNRYHNNTTTVNFENAAERWQRNMDNLQAFLEKSFTDLYHEHNKNKNILTKSDNVPSKDFSLLANKDSQPKWLRYVDPDPDPNTEGIPWRCAPDVNYYFDCL